MVSYIARCLFVLSTLQVMVGLGWVWLGWDGMGWDGKEETRTHSRSTAVIWYEATRVLVRDLTLIMVAELVHAW